MITFLKEVRFKSFFNKKIRKYFFYTVGEIFLIVFGILIALQVNNWNEERITLKNEKILLGKLLSDLNSDFIRFQELKIMYETSVENNVNLKAKLDMGKISVDNIDSTFFDVFNFSQLNPRTVTRDEMISFGGFHKVSNESLADSIHEYYKILERDAYYIQRHDQKIRTAELNPDIYDYKLLKNRFFNKYNFVVIDIDWINDPRHQSHKALYNLLLVASEENIEAVKIFEKLLEKNRRLREDLDIYLKK